MGCGTGILLIIPLFVILGVLYFLFPGANPWVLTGGGYGLWLILMFLWVIVSVGRHPKGRAVR